MEHKIGAAKLAILCMLALSPRTVQAQTVGQDLIRSCPNSAEIQRAQDQANEEIAIHSEEQYSSSREAARQYYRCSDVSRNTWVKEHALTLWAYFMLNAIKTDDETLHIASDVAARMNDLAAATKDNKTKNFALSTRKMARDMIARLLLEEPSNP